MCVRVYDSACVYDSVCVHVYDSACVCVCMIVHVCAYVCMSMLVYMYVCMDYMHSYIFVYTMHTPACTCVHYIVKQICLYLHT